MDASGHLDEGRRARRSGDWARAYDALRAAEDAGARLSAADHSTLGTAAALLGRDDEAEHHLATAHRLAAAAGDPGAAVDAAFWASFVLANRGENARARGWAQRARRVLPDHGARGDDRPQLAVALLDTLQELREGEVDGVDGLGALADRLAAAGDPDLAALARMAEGYLCAITSDPAGGVRCLDEVMAGVVAGEVAPLAAGFVFCVVLDVCRSRLDVRRSVEWTDALSRWCAAQPRLVPYRGQCLVHRVQVMQLQGRWDDAAAEAERACRWLSDPPQPAVGAAHYEAAELHRLRGDLRAAEGAYTEAARQGHDPQPGLGLLRLAQGRPEQAASGLRRSLAAPQDSTVLPLVLAAYVEALLACGEVSAAAAPAARLRELASAADVPVVAALADDAHAALALRAGDAAGALGLARRAWATWHALPAPYAAARSRVSAGLACRDLGDADGARLELEAAAADLDALGARREAGRVHRLLRGVTGDDACPLSPREREVVRLLAAGLTNRTIAGRLVLSERTIDRHVSNIFAKLAVPTRTAAAAWAIEHHLV